MLSLHEGIPIAIELPQRVTLRDRRDRARHQGPDRLLLLQARDPLQRRPHHGPAACRRRHAGGDHDRGRRLRGAGEGLTGTAPPAAGTIRSCDLRASVRSCRSGFRSCIPCGAAAAAWVRSCRARQFVCANSRGSLWSAVLGFVRASGEHSLAWQRIAASWVRFVILWKRRSSGSGVSFGSTVRANDGSG